jgi:hypothetical protein
MAKCMYCILTVKNDNENFNLSNREESTQVED